MNSTSQSHPRACALAGALVLASCLGVASAVMAGPYRHHRHIDRQDFNAYVDPGFETSGPSIGAWRFNTFRRGGCDSGYPMHEGYPCGSPTGGPVGGMGS